MPGEDIAIAFTGLRPGEKLFEELSVAAENADTTRHPKIFVGHTRKADAGAIARAIDELVALGAGGTGVTGGASCERSEAGEPVRRALKALIPEYTPDPSPDPLPSKGSGPSGPGALRGQTGPGGEGRIA